MSDLTVSDLESFGPRVRDRRRQLGLSVRALAARAGVSAAYVTSIELGRNPSTGRPPVPSIQVVANLASVLGLDASRLVGRIGPADPELPEDHVLLYCLDDGSRGLLEVVDRTFGAAVDHWLYVADPRDRDTGDLDGRATVLRWDLGSFPYETQRLDPAHLVAALEAAVRACARTQAGRRVGFAIADCSAVMRWVQNAAAEVALEETWHDHVHRIWTAHLGVPPAIDVCIYQHADLRALGLTIDQVATALALVRDHHRVHVLDGGAILTGPPAIGRILRAAHPAGVSESAWTDLTDAAAETLGARRPAAVVAAAADAR